MRYLVLTIVAAVGALIGCALVLFSDNWHLIACVWNGVAACLWFRDSSSVFISKTSSVFISKTMKG